ncbi:hypothetical protein LMG26411_04296 [Cupriavidus numazuensis]|uniref:Lipoprotein n=2 Tax=Cupriavidus numazuensis TaxID=221992 RepID=A0ABM8TL40_9BURK|nr:hypothetical protein LMG26411_04296 [Cupriavidus numazuensis]
MNITIVKRLILSALSLGLGACAVPPPYTATGDRSTQARLRVKAADRYAYPALMVVKTEDDSEPKEQFLAIFNKGWMGMGRTPKESELIGMPEAPGADTNMPVLERYVTGGHKMRLRFEARLDGALICGSSGAFTPDKGRDYELVVSILGTSPGGNGQCGLMLYELVGNRNTYERQALMLGPLPLRNSN